MDMGIWISKEVLARLREPGDEVRSWTLPHLPTGFEASEEGRLFVAVDDHWRGFFQRVPETTHAEADQKCSCTITFAPASWTPVLPERAPQENRREGFTLEVPAVDLIASGKINRQGGDQVGTLISLLKREEEDE
jgi:hypothetical protein